VRCSAKGCSAKGVVGWQRGLSEGSPQEVLSGDRVEVTGCSKHALKESALVKIHMPTCEAPPMCTCSPVSLPEGQG